MSFFWYCGAGEREREEADVDENDEMEKDWAHFGHKILELLTINTILVMNGDGKCSDISLVSLFIWQRNGVTLHWRLWWWKMRQTSTQISNEYQRIFESIYVCCYSMALHRIYGIPNFLWFSTFRGFSDKISSFFWCVHCCFPPFYFQFRSESRLCYRKIRFVLESP